MDLNQIQLSSLIAFLKIAQKKNFAAAALELRVSPPALSQSIKQLEKKLGVALFSRTTRKVTLTHAGEVFAKQCSKALESLQDSITSVSDLASEPSGFLRLTMPRITYFDLIEPILPGFIKKYPKISVEFYLADEFVDIVEMGLDGGIRNSEHVSTEMTTVRLSKGFKFCVVGTAEYFNKYGRPKKPQDLIHHDCLGYRFADGDMYDEWEFLDKGRPFTVKVKSRFIVNDSFAARSIAGQGLTLIYVSEQSYMINKARYKFEAVLEEYTDKTDGNFLYFPSRAQVQPKLRAFIDYIKTHAPA